MNFIATETLAFEHHRDLLRDAEQQRRVQLARQANVQLPRQAKAVSLSTSNTPCPTC
ncbi:MULTISPECIES: hypothetical protein [Deinococcus]|uniref:Uncharacterized protein n=1 Tax=Deinococcus phoenicis TaxID=1476583 RepID=A0A016QL14_9DEIO|nr:MULTISPECIES: hypothetical protein [Deinococcus]EYB66469.1 hypothetical protein DEIPH_ctg139orf0208 [Deinococcus phoenicis]